MDHLYETIHCVSDDHVTDDVACSHVLVTRVHSSSLRKGLEPRRRMKVSARMSFDTLVLVYPKLRAWSCLEVYPGVDELVLLFVGLVA